MLGLLVSLPLLFAQAPAQPAAGAGPAAPAPAGTAAPAAPGQAAAAGQAQPPASPLIQFLPFLAPLILLYFMMIRPQQQQERKRREMIDAIDRNARVVTAGGIHGTVVSINKEDETVTLRVDDERNVRLVISRSSIVKVVEPAAKKSQADKDV